jgi:hypothetical protein
VGVGGVQGTAKAALVGATPTANTHSGRLPRSANCPVWRDQGASAHAPRCGAVEYAWMRLWMVAG